ncbi:predicted protein [Naegleria gruberi]|uniref:Predicted protein n=1 Tax=Naegleria gruberi TaxID=5762 RepID=D2W4W7_NAEGR|nr:uncharacterized protein NAEGRDRAFT_76455 [Naegleria gruberi]EFC35889.1 predicted protein [Naegleria gruberi]|eukprot:XP_002668633.1 predicted protein [Naegleria gruberi strain NEG-M]
MKEKIYFALLYYKPPESTDSHISTESCVSNRSPNTNCTEFSTEQQSVNNSTSPTRLLSSHDNLSSASTPSSGGNYAPTKGQNVLQRSKAILSDVTNFKYFDKFKNAVYEGKSKAQTSSGSTTSKKVGGSTKKGRKH